jgi:hypothetical protein
MKSSTLNVKHQSRPKSPINLLLMKRTSYYLCAFFAILIACNEETPSGIEAEANLTAPNGDVLANSLTELKKWTADAVSDKFGPDTQFELTDIEYLNVKTGFVARINFKVGEIQSHFFIGNAPLTTPNGRVGLPVDPCKKWEINCSGNSCCTPTFNLNTGVASCTCSSGENSSCTLKANCLDSQLTD